MNLKEQIEVISTQTQVVVTIGGEEVVRGTALHIYQTAWEYLLHEVVSVKVAEGNILVIEVGEFNGRFKKF